MRGSGQDVACLRGTSVSLSCKRHRGIARGLAPRRGSPGLAPSLEEPVSLEPRPEAAPGQEAPTRRTWTREAPDASPRQQRNPRMRTGRTPARPRAAGGGHRPSRRRSEAQRSAEVRLLRRGRRSACPAFPGAGPPAPSLLTFHQVHARFSDEGRLRLPDRTQRRGGVFRRVGSPRPRPGLGPSPPGQCAGYSQASFPCSVFSTDPAVGPQEGWGTGPGNPLSRWLGVQQGAEEAGGACLRLGLLTALSLPTGVWASGTTFTVGALIPHLLRLLPLSLSHLQRLGSPGQLGRPSGGRAP